RGVPLLRRSDRCTDLLPSLDDFPAAVGRADHDLAQGRPAAADDRRALRSRIRSQAATDADDISQSGGKTADRAQEHRLSPGPPSVSQRAVLQSAGAASGAAGARRVPRAGPSDADVSDGGRRVLPLRADAALSALKRAALLDCALSTLAVMRTVP